MNFGKKVESAVVRKVLNGGIFINGEEFHFIGCSSGGLKSRTCYMFKGSQDDVKQIWAECGDFSLIKSRYKRLKRIGLLFSSAIPTGIEIPFSAVIEIPDIESVGHNFTDGCGAVSLDLAQRITTNCKLACPENYIPSVFQIRYQGCKGVVAVHKTLKEVDLAIRPSMKKFNQGTKPFEEIWLCSFSRPYTFGYLNRQFITLLHSLGVRDKAFLRIQNEHFQRLENLNCNIEAALEVLLLDNQIELAMTCTHPDFLEKCRSELTKIKTKTVAKLEKLRLPILKSRNVFGVCDTTGMLRYGQCYIRVTDKGQGKTIDGKVVVAKNPCYLLGDIRVLTAIDIRELDHLVDCIVFPTQGERPHPEEIAGSDLDGDQYFVSWDKDLIPPKTHKPYHYPSISRIEPSGEITPEILIDLFASQKNSMGKIDSYYKYWANKKGAGCTECETLGKLFSRSVDATKTGDIVSIQSNLIPPAVPEKKGNDYPQFVWNIMEEKALEIKELLCQKLLSNVDLNVTHLTEEFLLSLLDTENRISNITEFQRLKLIFQWCHSYFSSEVANQKFKEMSKLISFGELTLEQQVYAIDLGIPLKEVTNALNYSILPSNLIKKFSLDDPYRAWRFYFNSSSSDFKWRNLLHGIQNHSESFLVIQLPDEITFVVHFLSKIEPGETNIDNGAVVTYFSSNCFNLNFQCALSSDFSIILDEDKLQIYRGNIRATFIWLRNESTQKRAKDIKESSQDILYDRISVDLTRFKSDILRTDRHPTVNKQSFLSIEMFVKTESNIPAFLDYIEADIPGDYVVEDEPEMVDDIDCFPLDLTDSQKQILINHADPKMDDILTLLAHHASNGHLYNFHQTLKQIFNKDKNIVPIDQLLPCFIELLSTVVLKVGHEKILSEVEQILVEIFLLFAVKKISAMQVLQIISHAARLELFQWIENILISLLEIIEASEIAEYFDTIGNWVLWYHIPQSFSVRLCDHLYSLFLSFCDHSPTTLSTDYGNTSDPKQQEVDRYSIHFSHLIQSHLLCEMFDLKKHLGSFCDSISTLVRMRCYNYVSPHENAQDIMQESESSTLKIGFNRPSKGISSKAFIVGTFVLISVMIRSTPHLAGRSKPIAIGRIVKVCKQPADIVIELQQPIPECIRICLKDGVGHWELTLIGNVTLFKRSLSALKELQKNCISYPLLSLMVLTHKSIHNEPCISKEDIKCLSKQCLPPRKSDLNPNQQTAVVEALNRKITLVHGPPGTGKTHVACEIVSEQLARNAEYPILVVAETNMAVDNLCEKLLGRDIRVVRIGKLDQISNVVHCITLEGQIEKKRIQERKDKKVSKFFSKADIKPIFKAAQVVATTCTGAGDSCLKGMKFPFVVVDEATQVTEPTSLIPLMYGCQQLTLIGDPEQLAPSVSIKHNSPLELTELSITIFHRLQKLPSFDSVFLNEQHRMHPKLVEFPSTHFYGGKLVTANSRHEQKSIFQENVPFIDISNPHVFINCHQSEIRSGTSHSNLIEAQLVITVIKRLIDSKISSQQVVVLTPYSGQLKCIQNECQTHKLNLVRVYTIDSFQGREADIVIFSSVRCNPAHELGFLDDRYRINVLLTRARHCVIGIGSQVTLANGSPLWREWLSTVKVIEMSDLLKLIKSCSSKQKVSSSKQNSPAESMSGEFKESITDHHTRHKRGGRGQRSDYRQRSLDPNQACDHNSRSMRGNRGGRGRVYCRYSYDRRTHHEETGDFASNERTNTQHRGERHENVQHRGTGRRRPYRRRGHPCGTS